MDLKGLVGSGDRIGLFTLPFLIVGLVLNVAFPSLFQVGGPPTVLAVVSIVVLIAGVTIWIWSVYLILTKVPRGELITSGPYSLVKHPLYTAVALLVAPVDRLPAQHVTGRSARCRPVRRIQDLRSGRRSVMSKAFGARWDEYSSTVKMPWL